MVAHGGRVNPRSGARWDRKNDGRNDETLFEFKRTDNATQITIKFKDLVGVENNAVAEGRRGALGFELGGRDYIIRPAEDDIERGPGGNNRETEQLVPTKMVRQRKMPRDSNSPEWQSTGKPFLRRVSREWESESGEEILQGHPSRLPRPVPGTRSVSSIRSGTRSERRLRSVGRDERAGAPVDEETGAP